MRKKTIYIFILAFLFPLIGMAQYDSIVKKFKKEFDTFRQSIQQEHQAFRDKNDSIFSQFLKSSWTTFDVLYKSKPEKVKPKIPPIVGKTLKKLPSNLEKISDDSSQSKLIIRPEKKEIPAEKREQLEFEESGSNSILNINFYGSKSKLTYPKESPQISQISTEGINSYFDKAINSTVIYRMAYELKTLKVELRLNDWGFYKMVESCMGQFESDSSAQTLLTWIVLIKCGYKVKTGFIGNRVYLLLPFYEEITNTYYINVNGVAYYILSNKIRGEEIRKMQGYLADYPGKTLLSLYMFELPELGQSTISKELLFRDIKMKIGENEHLINFYNDIPLSGLKVYFSTPLSEIVIHSLEKYFNPLFIGMTEKEKVAVLLEFTQSSFSYQTDEDQFGHEKYFFPDELFFYPFSDCEDRAILFARLVKHFTKLNCIGLDYPNHVNTAVNFGEGTYGTYVLLNGAKYTICDPTCINGQIGYLPDEFKNMLPEVITFN